MGDTWSECRVLPGDRSSGEMGDTSSGWLAPSRHAVQEQSHMQQRKSFVDAVLRREHSFAEVCRLSMSAESGYKWWNRNLIEQAAGEVSAFTNRSRRPRTSPKKLAAELEDQIVKLRKQRPQRGPGTGV
jgi:hypothetical protein